MKKKLWSSGLIIILLFSLLFSISVSSAKASNILYLEAIDGDTAVDLEKNRYRLACIDAPELSQKHGKIAKTYFSSLIDESVTVKKLEIGKYGRSIVLLKNGEININLEMVKKGQAFVYKQYLYNCPELKKELISAQKQAEENRIGVWEEDDICYPWNYRKNKCNKESRVADVNCNNFSSWIEAQNFFKNYKKDIYQLDRDRDGIACEELIR